MKGSPPRAGPLAGLRVCDLSTVLAGPYCTMLLGDLGADVIKVEPPDGDPTRRYGPPYAGTPEPGVRYAQGDPRGNPGYQGESGYFLSVNRNKRGVVIDLGTASGRAALTSILRGSDVLVENFRAGGLDRLGFDDARLAQIDARLIHLAITGYGTTGPDAAKPGFDLIIQAASGLMSITGQPDDEGGRPTKVGVAVTDIATGMFGAVAILAALRARDGVPGVPGTGRGQRIDISLLESTVAWLINQAANHLIGGLVPGRMGDRHPNITPYETFRTADGELAVAVGSERIWARFCAALGLDELVADARFATNSDRVVERESLRAIVERRFAQRGSSDWLVELARAEVPCSPVRDMAAVFADPQVLAREMIIPVDHPTAGQIQLTGLPFKLAATPGAIHRPPPLLGEHTREVLAERGQPDAGEGEASLEAG
ncbi:MAG: CoA transferase [Chloroflexi bacterium]|nr:CoA transferase [Chloroflexota bacterium]